ncbi:MAG TPA: DMT family transporter [Candidatus Bathyarchaeia archaeon]|nr:DMT family transporter [Candidatus Bathyarchaeia archaeon]
MGNIIIAGIFLAILSYSMLNIGMGLQKKGASCLPKIENQSIGKNLKNFFTNKHWIIGFLLVQIQWVFLSMALDFASVSIVTPMMSVGMVALVIFSYFYLKEPIAKIEMIMIVTIIIGIAILGATTPRGETDHDLEFVLERMSTLGAIIFLIISFTISILLLVLCILRKYKNADILFSISAGITDALGAIFLRAVMGGADFRNTGVASDAVTRWGWWVIMILMIILNATATIYLQVAYQKGKAVIVAPIFSVFAMMTPVFGGIIIFNEWNVYITEEKLGLMSGKIIALVIIVIGVIILSRFSARKRKFETCEIGVETSVVKTEEKLEVIENKETKNN